MALLPPALALPPSSSSPAHKKSCGRLALFLVLALASLSFPAGAFGQVAGRKLLPKPAVGSESEYEKDQPQKRAQWNMRGRVAPKGESAAALRLRAHQQKMAMRAQRVTAKPARAQSQPQGIPPGWVSLGPSPLASDATGDGGQNYNWVSGRATSVLIDPADTTGNTVLLGGAYGGLWKSTNAGSASSSPSSVTWQSLIDDQPSLAVGAIALQPGNSNVILAGTGETNSSGDSYYGMGILRSSDGGATWTQITSAASGQSFLGVGFSKIAFSTSNTSLVVASTAADIGFDYGLEQDAVSTARGLYYSTDAGVTWNRVTLADGAIAASVTGVAYNPSAGTGGTFFAAIRRHGIYSSTDGQHFSRLSTQPTTGLTSSNCPANSNSTNCPLYRAEFAVTPGRNETYVWIVDSQSTEVDEGVWKSSNGGTSWTQIPDTGITDCGNGGGGETSGDGCGVQQGTYNLEIAAVPNGTGTDLYAGTINLYKCNLASGASSCSTIDSNVPTDWINLTHVYGCTPLGELAHVHPDQHGLSFLVASGKAVGYFAHDGGVSRTLDGFTGLNSGSCTGANQFDSLSQTLGSMTEFVSFSVHPSSADILLGGTQDNGSPKTATATSSTSWQNALGGDGGYNAINPNPGPAGVGDGVAGDEWFVSQPDTSIGVCEDGTACNDNDAYLEADSSNLDGDIGAFYTPFILDPQNTSEMLIGTCRVWRGDTASSTFTTLSTNFDTGRASVCNGSEVNQVAGLAAGGPQDNNGFSNVVYATTWGYGPLANVGGGEVWVTTNAATTLPTNVTGSINPSHYAIAAVALDTSDGSGQTAYVGIMGFHASHVFKTTNAGAAWTNWTGSGSTSLPDAPVSSIVVDSVSGTVYAGTDVGVFSSPTSGSTGVWTEVGPAAMSGPGFLPSAPVTALQLFNNGLVKELRVSTYGRGIWQFNIPLAPDFTDVISNSPQTVLPSQTATFNGTVTAVGGYSSRVDLSCTGTPPSTCTLNPTHLIPAAPTGVSYTVTASDATAGDYAFNVHAVGTDSSTVTHDTPVVLHVVDFAVGATNPTTITVPQGLSASAAFQVSALGSFSSSVTLSCSSGLPSGAACTFQPNPVSPTSASPANPTITVSATGSTPIGTYTITLQGVSTTPAATRTTTFTLSVVAAPDFSIATSGSTSHTVLAGQTTPTYSFVVTAVGGAPTFLGPVTFSPSGAPVRTAFNLPTIAAGTSSPQTVTLTISTTGPNTGTGSAVHARRQPTGKRTPWLPLSLPLAGIVVLGISRRKLSRHFAISGLAVCLALLVLLVACGGGGGSNTPPPVSITISPNVALSLYANEAGNQWPASLTEQQFNAEVSNTNNTTVTWEVNGMAGGNATYGTITSGGLYTAPATAPGGSFSVTAVAAADTTKTASDVVTIQNATPTGTSTITITATEGAITHNQTITLTVQ